MGERLFQPQGPAVLPVREISLCSGFCNSLPAFGQNTRSVARQNSEREPHELILT